jgi:hypothetical protein
MKFLDVPQSGSIAGNTHSHNRAGQYKRNRRSPVQPIGTGRRAFIKGAFASGATSWAGLTDAQRNAWTSFAASHPITDALGQSIILTGMQMFVRMTIQLLNVNQPAPTTPPTTLTTTSINPVTATFSITTGISIAFTAADGDGYVTYAFSRPMSAGRTFNATWWQPLGALGFADDAGTPATVTTANYAAQFGAPTVGQKVFVKVNHFTVDGWLTETYILPMIVTA